VRAHRHAHAHARSAHPRGLCLRARWREGQSASGREGKRESALARHVRVCACMLEPNVYPPPGGWGSASRVRVYSDEDSSHPRTRACKHARTYALFASCVRACVRVCSDTRALMRTCLHT
jgi:hypothetical protein